MSSEKFTPTGADNFTDGGQSENMASGRQAYVPKADPKSADLSNASSEAGKEVADGVKGAKGLAEAVPDQVNPRTTRMALEADKMNSTETEEAKSKDEVGEANSVWSKMRRLGRAAKAGVTKAGPAAAVGATQTANAGAAGLQAAKASLSNMLSSIVGAAKGGFAALSSTVGGVLGVGSAAATTISGFLVASLVALPALGMGAMLGDDGDKAPMLDDCQKDVDAVIASVSDDGGGEEDIMRKMLENARKFYSAYKAMGFTDVQLAALFSNFQAESHLDSTTIEGVFGADQAFKVTEKKKKIVEDPDPYTKKLIAQYGSKFKINTGTYCSGEGGKCWPGMGIVQWTPGEQLVKQSAKVGMTWDNFDFQIAYLTLWKNSAIMKFRDDTKNNNDVTDVARHWFPIMAGGTYDGALGDPRYKSHVENVQQWLEKVKTFKADEKYGQSILDMAKKLGGPGGEASADAIAAAKKSCKRGGTQVDNSDLVMAAISYSYGKKSKSVGDNGTRLYRKLIETIPGALPHYQSCDRGTMTAVIWSGTDPDAPIGATTQIHNYFESQPDKWEKIGKSSELSESDLEPGDIFVIGDGTGYCDGRPGHIWMYVGADAIKKANDKLGGDQDGTPFEGKDVSASYQQRSASTNDGEFSHLGKSGDYCGRDLDAYRFIGTPGKPLDVALPD